MRRTFDGAILEESHYDPLSDVLTVNRVQDVEPILEANKADFINAPELHSQRYKKPLVHAARIPLIVVEQWLKMGINVFDPSPEMKKKVRQMLNSPDWRHLKTIPGKI